MTNLVKAKTAFYHDVVGTKAHNEVFEVKNAQVLSDLEKAGYVEKIEGQEAQEMQQRQQLQEQMGQKQALTNEAVSLAQYEQNVRANNHTQQQSQQRQQARQQASQQQPQQQNQQQNNQAAKTNTKKATDK